MGHRTIKTTQIYGKVARKRKADVIKFLNEKAEVTKPKKKKGKYFSVVSPIFIHSHLYL